jgi:hypothetical protein
MQPVLRDLICSCWLAGDVRALVVVARNLLPVGGIRGPVLVARLLAYASVFATTTIGFGALRLTVTSALCRQPDCTAAPKLLC